MARFDVLGKDHKVIVPRDKRITAKHIRELVEAGVKKLAVPNDYILGRALATNIVDKTTGEVLAKANDEITEELLQKLQDAGVASIETIYTNDLDQGAYISQTLRADDTPDQTAARVAIYRMMRPGEPPTEDSVESLFNGLFFAAERYDLSAVGRMKFNRRVGRTELTGTATSPTTTSSPSSRSWSNCATAAARSTTSTTSATAACARLASSPKTSFAPASSASSAR